MSTTSRLALLVLALLPALAVADSANSLTLNLDALRDTESPAGDRAEKYGPGFGLEYSREVWPQLDLYGGAGIHRLRIEENGSKSNLAFVDLNLGARQYFTRRSIDAWSPYLDLALVDAWLRDSDSTTGGNRRYDGWKAALGVGKLLTAQTELRIAVAYQRLRTSDRRNDFTDVLSAAGFRLGVAARF
jgi:hypothetical protein